jgi:hypothetical protein
MSDNEKESALSFDSSDQDSAEAYQQHLDDALKKRQTLSNDGSDIEKAIIDLDIAAAQIGLGKKDEAWTTAKQSFDTFLKNEQWQEAVEACETLYLTEAPAAINALAHGIWLSVTFPIAAQTSLTMLNYVIDETPKESDGAAVAAVAAHYIVDMRCNDDKREDLLFLSKNMLTKVAERHSNIESQQALDIWMQKLDLLDPSVFLSRLAKILDIIILDNWWFDRDELRKLIPDN